MIEQHINDEGLQKDNQPDFDEEGGFGSFMPVGNHSEQSTGGSAKESQEKEQGFRDSSLMLFGPAFVESESKKSN